MGYLERYNASKALGRALAISTAYAIIDRPAIATSLRGAVDHGIELRGEFDESKVDFLALRCSFRATATRVGIDQRTANAIILGLERD